MREKIEKGEIKRNNEDEMTPQKLLPLKVARNQTSESYFFNFNESTDLSQV